MNFPIDEILAAAGLTNGSRANFGINIKSIMLIGGDSITIPKTGVTVVVGPNNSGKSTLLKEIDSQTQLNALETIAPKLVSGIKFDTNGTASDLMDWIRNRAGSNQHGEPRPISGGHPLSESFISQNLARTWDSCHSTGRLGSRLSGFLIHRADTENRLVQSHAAPVRENALDNASHPLHAISDDRSILVRLSELSQQVFGEKLNLDDYSAKNRIRVGKITNPAPKRDEVDDSYRAAMLKLPELEEQGDGMRSFFGLLLPLLAGEYPMVLVDEPEAFLHPPQAAALGRTLGELATTNDKQIILATHDRNLLSGLLDSGISLTIIRVERVGDKGSVHQIDEQEVRQIWSEPSLRYSNALDGLFHRLVVLVEGDSDARFYSAVLSSMEEDGLATIPASDVLFVPCAGKGGLAKLARTLSSLSITVVAMPDIDILENRHQLSSLVSALGGEWENCESDYGSAVSSIGKVSQSLKVEDIKNALGPDDNVLIDGALKSKISRLLTVATGKWGPVKAAGVDALGSGGAGAAAHRLLRAFDGIGLVVVSEGELESFARDLNVAKGPKWVDGALAEDAHKSKAARDQISRCLAFAVS